MISKRATLRNAREHDTFALEAAVSMESSLSKFSPRTRTDLLNARRAAAVSAVHAFQAQCSDPHSTIAPLAWTTACLVKLPPLDPVSARVINQCISLRCNTGHIQPGETALRCVRVSRAAPAMLDECA